MNSKHNTYYLNISESHTPLTPQQCPLAQKTSPMIDAFESIRKCLTDVKTRGLVNHMPAKKELLRRAIRRVKKLLVIVRNGTLGKTGTSKSKVKNTLLGGEILPSSCT